mmetsp:Transcript_26757/g.68147  ORF Transcript_26757/g.68147 Transcript_26757/m.68147 type:complete len:301 (+) Transcript_26757:836-1738(+)
MEPPATVLTVQAPPGVMKGTPRHTATRSAVVANSGCTVSNTRFLGTSCSSGSPGKPWKVTRVPGGTPAGGSTSSTVAPSALVAASTMAWLCTPRMAAGFRLHSTHTRRPCISASGMYLTSPLTTWRGVSSPTSISSTYSESASGWRHAFLISPTLMSRRDTSTARSGSGAALGALGAPSFFSFSPPAAPFSFLSPPPAAFLSPPSAFLAPASPLAGLAPDAAAACLASRSAWLPPYRARRPSIVSSAMAVTRGAGVPMAWPAGGASVWGANAPLMRSSVRSSADAGRLSCASTLAASDGM